MDILDRKRVVSWVGGKAGGKNLAFNCANLANSLRWNKTVILEDLRAGVCR